jgi:hypothetical protein
VHTTALRTLAVFGFGCSLLTAGVAWGEEPVPPVATPAPASTPAAVPAKPVTPAPAAKTPAKPATKAAAKPAEKKLAPSNLSAQQIMEKNTAARGGLTAWRAIKTMRLSGKMDAGQPVKPPVKPDQAGSQASRAQSRTARIEAAKARDAAQTKGEAGVVVQVPFVMELKRPRKQRVEIQFEGETAVQVYDGEQGWKLRPYLGRHEVEVYSPEELKIAAQQNGLDGPLIDAAAKGHKVVVEGMEKLEGRNTYRLKLTQKGGQVRHVWVDAVTFLEAQTDEVRRAGSQDRTLTTILRDYKTVGAVKVPYRYENRVAKAKTTEKILVEKVELNPVLDDTRFAKPQ